MFIELNIFNELKMLHGIPLKQSLITVIGIGSVTKFVIKTLIFRSF